MSPLKISIPFAKFKAGISLLPNYLASSLTKSIANSINIMVIADNGIGMIPNRVVKVQGWDPPGGDGLI